MAPPAQPPRQPSAEPRSAIAAIRQIRYDTSGRAYYLRKIEEGKTKKEARRALKRRLSDAVYRQFVVDAARAMPERAREDTQRRSYRHQDVQNAVEGDTAGERPPRP